MSVIFINPFRFAPPYDADAQAYITAVEAADTQALEAGVCDAINAFVVGCKADGIWSAIKASCILAGARTKEGAIVPLVNASAVAPTLNGTAGGWSYNRKTGLQSNGTDNYINSGRNNNADPQNNFHLSVWASATGTSGYYAAGNWAVGSTNGILNDASNTRERWGNRSAAIDQQTSNTHTSTGLKATTRSNSSSFSVRTNGATVTPTNGSLTSVAPESSRVYIFARNGTSGTPAAFLSNTARLAFYSIGESLDLALLDTRVTTLINAIAAAIP